MCPLFAGIDHLLAQHVAHLFIRDPLTLFEEKIHLDDANESDHFEVFPIVNALYFTNQDGGSFHTCEESVTYNLLFIAYCSKEL